MEELIDVLDENGYKVGIVKEKSKVKKDGDYHRAISVCIINPDGEILMQKRSQNKRIYPGLWSMFTKGHVRSGENSRVAVIREIKEELGITVLIDDFDYLYTIYEEKNEDNYRERIFFDTFLLIKDIDISSIKMNDEVDNVMFIKLKDLCDLINNCDNRIVPNNLDYQNIFPHIVYSLEDYQKQKILKK